ncbi:hypothetical protein [Cryobacterium aureum]|uniref:hypothetical protein n=1 Tax=Cryobacterium aureum TaxID=995037 RepID=UPI00101AE555|nr:hypothetical protein [Cryobacterium aureum]
MGFGKPLGTRSMSRRCQRDRQPAGHREHQADGVATRDGIIELVEVELTPKTWQRYQKIVTNHAYRLVHEHVDRVAYFCTTDPHRAIIREADKRLVHPNAHGWFLPLVLTPAQHLFLSGVKCFIVLRQQQPFREGSTPAAALVLTSKRRKMLSIRTFLTILDQ